MPAEVADPRVAISAQRRTAYKSPPRTLSRSGSSFRRLPARARSASPPPASPLEEISAALQRQVAGKGAQKTSPRTTAEAAELQVLGAKFEFRYKQAKKIEVQ